MTSMTFTQLEALPETDIFDFRNVEIVGLPREIYEKRYGAMVERMEPDVAENFDPATSLSDLDLYASVRINRAPEVMSYDEVQALDDDAVMDLSNTVIEGFPRADYVVAYEANRSEIEPPSGQMLDSELYSSVRINGYTAEPAPPQTVAAPSM